MRAAIGRVSDFVMQDDDGDCRALLLGGDVVEAHDGEAARLLMRAVRGIADSELALVAAVAPPARPVTPGGLLAPGAAYQRFARKVAGLDDDTASEALGPLQAADWDLMRH